MSDRRLVILAKLIRMSHQISEFGGGWVFPVVFLGSVVLLNIFIYLFFIILGANYTRYSSIAPS